MQPTTRLITTENWARIYRDYPESVPIVRKIDCPYDAQLDTSLSDLRERVNELIMDWLKANKQLIEKVVQEKKYRFQAKEMKKQHHKTLTELQKELEAASEIAQKAAQKAEEDTQKLKETPETAENEQLVKRGLELSQKVKELIKQLAPCYKQVESLQKKNKDIQKELKDLRLKALVTISKVKNVGSTSLQESQQQAVEILNDRKLIHSTTHLIGLTKKIAHELDVTKGFIGDTLEAGREGSKSVEKSVSSTKMGVLEVAAMVLAATPFALWTGDQELNNWQLLPPKERFNKLCQSIDCGTEKLKAAESKYETNDRIYKPFNWVERIFAGQYSQVADVIPYPTLHVNYCLRKKFPDFSYTFVNEEREFHAGNQNLRDCYALEIINSDDLGESYSIHAMHGYLKPNRVIKDEDCMVMEGLRYHVWGLGLQDVKEVYVLVRFPPFFSQFSFTSFTPSLIQKVYRHPMMPRDGRGRDEDYSNDKWLGNINLSSDIDPSTVYMYSVANCSLEQNSLFNICELAIWEGIKVIGFLVHRPNSQPDNYLNWESVKPQERYDVLMRFLEVKDTDFSNKFNQRFSDYSCFYVGRSYVNPGLLTSCRLNQDIQLQLSHGWEITEDYIKSWYEENTLMFTVTNVEKIFVIAHANRNQIISVIVSQMDRIDPIRTEKIRIDSYMGIYNVVNLIAQSGNTHSVKLKFPSDIKVKGFIFQ